MGDPIDPHHKAYVCTHVFDKTAPVRLVSRPDGDWCFLCGNVHEENAEAYRVVGVGHLFADDPTLVEINDLPPGYEAERLDPGEPWIRTKVLPDS